MVPYTVLYTTRPADRMRVGTPRAGASRAGFSGCMVAPSTTKALSLEAGTCDASAAESQTTHRHFGKTAIHGVRSTVRPTRLGEAVAGTFAPPQGGRPRRLPRGARPNGLHAASSGRQVHSRRGGGVHRPAARHRIPGGSRC